MTTDTRDSAPTTAPKSESWFHRKTETLAQSAAHWTGTPTAFVLALAIVIAWILSGPLFHYSENWQLVINTSTTIITFLMVFLIQRAENKESLAVQLKLNELVAALRGASNRLVDVESMSESELAELHRHFSDLASLARNAHDIRASRSIDENTNQSRQEPNNKT